jgi:hypothetical protein
VSLLESPALSYVNSFFLQTFYSFLLSPEYTIRLAFDKAKAVVEEEAPTINISKSMFLLPDHESHDVIAMPGAPAGTVQLFDPVSLSLWYLLCLFVSVSLLGSSLLSLSPLSLSLFSLSLVSLYVSVCLIRVAHLLFSSRFLPRTSPTRQSRSSSADTKR